MFTIQSHGIKYVQNKLSYAQTRLLNSEAPIRICGAPTGAGKTYAFLQLAKTQLVFFVVPTQALAKDIEKKALSENIPVERWDFTTTLAWIEQAKKPWQERKTQLENMAMSGGIIVATLEALGNLVMGKPGLQNVDTGLLYLLWEIQHLVFDEAHTLNERAFGLVHLMMTLIADFYQKNPNDAPKLSLLSATHSNLFHNFIEAGYLPTNLIDIFDEQITDTDYDYSIHGDVEVTFRDQSLDEVVTELASPLLSQLPDGQSLLLIYDTLKQFVADEAKLARLFDDCGLARNQVIVINGQDKLSEFSLGSSHFDAGSSPLPRHKVIVGTSAVEMGVNFQVQAAIIEHGIDAAALLQRIGRVARGAMNGIVYVCRSSIAKNKRPVHLQILRQLAGKYTITALRDTEFKQLRTLNFQRAKALGSAYWSMLSRCHLGMIRDAAKPAVEALSGNPKLIPGWPLDKIHQIAKKSHWRVPKLQKCFQKWLKHIDYTLQDVRGFSPTVQVRFQGRKVEYSKDWIESKLEWPDKYDSEHNILIYDNPRDYYLRDKPREIDYSVFTPYDGMMTIKARSFEEAQGRYINQLESSARKYRREPGFQESLNFIKQTGLLPRENLMDSPNFSGIV
jgi:hypothetical protein